MSRSMDEQSVWDELKDVRTQALRDLVEATDKNTAATLASALIALQQPRSIEGALDIFDDVYRRLFLEPD